VVDVFILGGKEFDLVLVGGLESGEGGVSCAAGEDELTGILRRDGLAGGGNRLRDLEEGYARRKFGSRRVVFLGLGLDRIGFRR
jgi:hypothetical protein